MRKRKRRRKSRRTRADHGDVDIRRLRHIAPLIRTGDHRRPEIFAVSYL
jgi:hypothetical protein